jgi:NADH dehydrogenase [ubiquinone] 1 alpha subcomplex assembly factor 7
MLRVIQQARSLRQTSLQLWRAPLPFALERSVPWASTATSASPPREAQTPLGAELSRQILFSGPIPVDQYMRLCLTHPNHGYYTTSNKVFGKSGDFVTAPDVSQVFGEMIAVWIADTAAQLAKKHGADRGFAIAELGPGNGTLMKDILRSLRALRSLPSAVHLVEASMVLRDVQEQCLVDIASENGIDLRWFAALDNVPDAGTIIAEIHDTAGEDAIPTIYIAQEFFDALAVNVFQRVAAGKWRERFVDVVRGDVDESGNRLLSGAKNESTRHFRFVLAPGDTPASSILVSQFLGERAGSTSDDDDSPSSVSVPFLTDPVRVSDEGEVIELGADGIALAQLLAARVMRSGGAALIVDYGYDVGAEPLPTCPPPGNTIRAISGHRMSHVLSSPGLCDITADVNFAHLREAVRPTGAAFHGSVTQRDMLLRLGAAARFRRLGLAIVDNLTLDDEAIDEKLAALQEDYDRLVEPEQMGTLYRVSAITHPSLQPLVFTKRPA